MAQNDPAVKSAKQDSTKAFDELKAAEGRVNEKAAIVSNSEGLLESGIPLPGANTNTKNTNSTGSKTAAKK